MAKFLIAVPCMDSNPVEFTQSLATLNKIGESVLMMRSGSLVYTSREALATEAVRLGADYVMWFDSDLMFGPDTMQRLFADIEQAGDGVVMTGVYYRRQPPFSPVVYSSLDIQDEKATWTEMTDVPDDLFEVAGCGFGCVLTPTTVFIDVMSKFGTMFNPIGGTGEDLAFCWRARQCGWRFVADPHIWLGHVSKNIITADYWNDYKAFTKDGQK